MRLGKRTAKLVREAIVLAHVEGARWAGHVDPDNYPKDSDVVRKVLISATRLGDLYPTLSTLDAAQAADAEYREQCAEAIKALMVASESTKEARDA